MLHKLDAKNKLFSFENKSLVAAGLMIFFWAIFDGIGTFSLPILMTENGISKTGIGLIIGFSSVAGAIFDFILGRFIKNPNFRRLYGVMILLCIIYPLILLNATNVAIFLFAMIIWGIYYDLFGFGNLDFISRSVPSIDHTRGFGIIWTFKNLGYTIAPIIAGIIIVELIDWKTFGAMWVFIGIALIFYLLLFFYSLKQNKDFLNNVNLKSKTQGYFSKNVFKIIKIILPILLCTTFINILDSFYWTLGPLIAIDYEMFNGFDGIFLALYTIPSLLLGWISGKFILKSGKKHTTYLACLIGSILISIYPLIQNANILLIIVFISSCFFAIAWPTINSVYSDLIFENSTKEKEIESSVDFFTNVGYIIGPIMAGFFADKSGDLNAFSYLGIIGIITMLLLFKFTPKNLNLKFN